jgi:hypothetical protein
MWASSKRIVAVKDGLTTYADNMVDPTEGLCFLPQGKKPLRRVRSLRMFYTALSTRGWMTVLTHYGLL